jgi:hypothetical protein
MLSRNQHSGAPARQTKVSRRQASDARAQLAGGGLSHQERRRLRSIIRAWDETAPRRSLEFRHVIVAVAGAVVAMAVVVVSIGLVSAIKAARGQGTTGTFVVNSQSCSARTGCTWIGTFRPPDGDEVPGVVYEGSLPAGSGPGTDVPAIEPDGSHYVYAPPGSHAWIGDLLPVVIVGGAVGFVLWLFPVGLRRRKTAAPDAG